MVTSQGLKASFPVVMVYWGDPYMIHGWEVTKDNAPAMACITAGFLVYASNDRVEVALNMSDDGPGDVQVLPRKCVDQIIMLEEKDEIKD